MLCLSYYCLCFLFNKIRDKDKFCLEVRGGQEEREEMGGRGEKWLKQCIHM
jgi:hypothetical protein